MTARAAEKARADALALFEKDDVAHAEVVWKRMRGLEEDADRERRDVCEALDLALALDPGDRAARALYADVTLARLLAAERLHEEGLARRASRTPRRLRRWLPRRAATRAGARARRDRPPGAALTLARYREDAAGRLVESDRAPLAAGDRRELEPGSYLIVAKAPGATRRATRSSSAAAKRAALRVVLPRAADVPGGDDLRPGRADPLRQQRRRSHPIDFLYAPARP